VTTQQTDPFPNETIGVDDLPSAPDLAGTIARKNVPILMFLQGESVGRKHRLKDAETVIGRAADCAIQLTDVEVSRNHSAISYANLDDPESAPQCILRDLNSKNGTFVNGKRITVHALQDKDIISLGATALGYYLKDEVEVQFDAELYSMATVDSLTGVYNKQYFYREFQREMKRVERGQTSVSLVFCDLDHFKRVNDTHGHLAGDYVLRKLGEILLGNVREYDICARYGGEEFAIILAATDMEGAKMVAERLRQRVENCRFEYEGIVIPMTISIGVATNREDLYTVTGMIQAADDALYRAKKSGRNRVVGITDP